MASSRFLVEPGALASRNFVADPGPQRAMHAKVGASSRYRAAEFRWDREA